MFCGTVSFKNVDADPWTPPSPKAAAKKKKAGENPYSARGLDKFSTLVAELEARKERVLAKAASQGAAAMVRFTYSGPNEWIPIIVKIRDPQVEAGKPSDVEKLKAPPPPVQDISEAYPPEKDVGEGVETVAPERKPKGHFSWGVRGAKGWSGKNWRPSYHWPLVAVLMLLCLVMFGRVFAICCTTVWWYMVPIMQGESGEGVRRSIKKKTKKKDYGRRLSDKRMAGNLAPAPSFQANKVRGMQEPPSPRGHVNGKKG
ncbi:hypothetical protein OPV22_035141 [Ensete ventricosum]|uniref:ZCF37 n=1 Tax=Ensete ventricosum TaxID=4639 RepID=A0AAX5NBG4_ENSVE|nr:hypothetical protein OPV22_035141 [Ensete ventricosum]RWV93030.1 hypothetical protein GW17_00044546 [Ensete ventricosum]